MTEREYRKETYCPTSEEWYPNYEGDKVRVAMYINKNKKQHCICVWGNDDMGMELWSKDPGIVKKLYQRICRMHDVTRNKLTKLGLVRA